MATFLEPYKLLRLKQEETENLIRLITSDDIESVIKKLPTNKSPRWDRLTGDFYQTFREGLTPILLKILQKLEEEQCFLQIPA